MKSIYENLGETYRLQVPHTGTTKRIAVWNWYVVTAIPQTSERKPSHYLLHLFDKRHAQQTPQRDRYTSWRNVSAACKITCRERKCYRKSESQRYDVMGSEDE